MTTTAPHTPESDESTLVDLDEKLTPDILSAMMRSTWTWDDRALRRDLSSLLVNLTAAQSVRNDQSLDTTKEATDILSARAYADAARFISTVLGPNLIADTGNAFRKDFAPIAFAAAAFELQILQALPGVTDKALSIAAAALATTPRDETASTGDVTAATIASRMQATGSTSSSSFFASVALAAQALSATGDEAAADLIAHLGDGATTATLAVAERTGSWDPALVRTRAVKDANGWCISGDKQFVPDADSADVILVIARSIAGPSLFAVQQADQQEGLTIAAQESIDPTRPFFRVGFDNVRATLIGREGSGGRSMSRTLDLATTALASEQVGIVNECLHLVVDSAEAATPILTNSAHETLVLELVLLGLKARSLRNDAVAAAAENSAYSSVAAAKAHIGCSEAAVQASTIAVAALNACRSPKVSDAHRLAARAHTDDLLFGGPALSHERLLERLGV